MSEIPDRNKKRMSEVPSAFFSSPAAGGIVLIIASAAAIIVANSPLREGYEVFLKYNAAASPLSTG